MGVCVRGAGEDGEGREGETRLNAAGAKSEARWMLADAEEENLAHTHNSLRDEEGREINDA